MNILKPPGSYLTVGEIDKRDKRNRVILRLALQLLKKYPVRSRTHRYAMAAAVSSSKLLHYPQPTLRR